MFSLTYASKDSHKQECIPVGCVPAARRPYAGVCFPGGCLLWGCVSAPGGLLWGCLLRGGLPGPGGCLLRGERGVCLLQGGGALGGNVCSRGVCLVPGGVCLVPGGVSAPGGGGGGGGAGIPVCTEADPLLPCEQNDKQV